MLQILQTTAWHLHSKCFGTILVSCYYIIQAERAEYRAGKLMEILEQVDDSYLPQFYEALRANNQTDVIQLMNFKGTTMLTLLSLLKIQGHCAL